MGTWGAGIFADDVAMDVRDGWREAILDGQDAESALRTLEGSFAYAIDHPDESIVFWLALATAQMETGRLLDTVRDRAVAIIDAGADVARWESELGQVGARQRAKVITRLREKLLGPQPEPKRIRRKPFYGVPFDPGDVVLLRNPMTGNRGLVFVVDRYDDRTPDPVVEVLIWDGAEIPSEDELAVVPAARLDPRAGRGEDGRARPLYFVIHTWHRDEAFAPELGEVIAKGIPRKRLADWQRGALSIDSPCYTDYNLDWHKLARRVGSPRWKEQFKITKAEIG